MLQQDVDDMSGNEATASWSDVSIGVRAIANTAQNIPVSRTLGIVMNMVQLVFYRENNE